MYYEKVFRALEKEEIKYLLVGGIAVNLYGVLRTTVDMDIMLELSNENVKKAIKVIEKLGYKPRAPVKGEDFADGVKRKEWIEKKNMRVFSFFHPTKPLEEIDVFLENPINFDRAYESKKIMNASGIKIPVISIADLIKLKKLSGRPQDLADIDGLKRSKKLSNGQK